MASEPDDDPALPPLRADLEPVPVQHEGQSMFVLHDPEGLCAKPLALSPGGLLLASLLDGRRGPGAVASMLSKATGQLVQKADVARIVDQLEKASLLETPDVRERRRRIVSDFLAGSARPARLGYPSDPLELARLLGGYFRDPKGPGRPLPDAPAKLAPPKGLVAPHIDLDRGGPAYAWAYRELADSPPPDLIVALGVAHASPNAPWTLTRKAYETPCGPMKVDGAAYEAVARELWYDPLDDEWVHRQEHSLELQAIWLRFLWKERTPAWLPILCSTFERFSPDRPPSAVENVETAIRRVGEMLAERAKSQRILVLAGVDLAHVGPHFGDDFELGPEVEKRIEREDRASLDHAMKLEADPFYLSVVSDGHTRKVCGLSALYTSLRWMRALGAGTGELLTYGQAPDPRGGLVSFTGAVFR